MGLFDMFKKKAEPATAAAPSSISASAGADVLCSPVKGKVIKMADVPDPVFGGEVLGKAAPCGPRTTWSTLLRRQGDRHHGSRRGPAVR